MRLIGKKPRMCVGDGVPPEYDDVARETMLAYADCTMEGTPHESLRNLGFHARRPVPAAVGMEIMRAAVPDGYNEFTYDLVGRIEGEVILAREGSVCVYVLSPGTAPDLKEDERDEMDAFCSDKAPIGGRALRLWWD
jgi:hypothetical protein